nr:immunoglobulin light chain junction region [Macaca mulatta]MOW69878.1 immunoglobulin light chain junction region [Macaca mulatta]MOW70963.1 immunoglobulin light chain junction region [Macaca mulatta]MOW72553.1 immunoglobulin light chain junction region [Macaca mulatta]
DYYCCSYTSSSAFYIF